MIRSFALASALATAFAVPAVAEDAALSPADAAAINRAILAQTASQHEAFQHLARQGYVNIALSEKDNNGRWVGTAFKDGRTVIVAVDTRHPAAAATTN